MRCNIEKILDSKKNVIGYQTTNVKSIFGKELIINLPINKNLAESIFDNISELKSIPETITGVTNTDIYIKETPDNYVIIFPDEKGKYPWEPNCNDLFKEQIKRVQTNV